MDRPKVQLRPPTAFDRAEMVLMLHQLVDHACGMIGRTDSLGGRDPKEVALDTCNWLEAACNEGMQEAGEKESSGDDTTPGWFELHRNFAQTRRLGLNTTAMPGSPFSQFKVAANVNGGRTT